MKFGETLSQRSVPQWQNFNIDYQTFKTYIKDATSPNKANSTVIDKGKGKTVAIPVPGSEPPVEPAPTLEDTLYTFLKNEHDRVGLFVTSKQYEIGSRLGSIERQLNQLQRRKSVGVGTSKMAVKLRSRISKIETDILSVGSEIQNLSRFVSINRLAIRKLLKKHEKWTGSPTLGQTVQQQLLDQPESFTKTELDEALGRYTRYLSAVREPFNLEPSQGNDRSPDASSGKTREKPQKHSLGLTSLFHKSDIDFDAAMALLGKSQREERIVYWVHQDNVVELRILLLQHMRYANFGNSDDSEGITATTTDYGIPDDQDGKAICAGAIVMAKSKPTDDNGEISEEVSVQETTPIPAAIARWTAGGNARVCMRPSKAESDTTGIKTIVKLDRDRLMALLLLESSSRRAHISRLTEEEKYATSDDDKSNDNALRGYIQRNADLKAVARIVHKRSRFVGLDNALDRGCWASLDEDVRFASMSGNERRPSEVYKVPDDGGRQFPHAVLSLRAAGASPALIGVLDNSHLTERVDNFSLEAHVYATCHGSKQSPSWLPKLTTDIRHIPSPEPSPLTRSQTCSRKSSNIDQFTNSSSSKLQTPNLTSRSGTSDSRGPITPDAEVFVPPNLRAPNKKTSKSSLLAERANQRSRRLHLHQNHPELQVPPEQEQKYWNEYDNPTSDMGGDGEEFVIYVDPNAPLFPGQVTIGRWCHSVKRFFSTAKERPTQEVEAQRVDEDRPRTINRKLSQLLSIDSGQTSSDEEDNDANADADDEQSHSLLYSPHFPLARGKQDLKSSINDGGPKYGTFILPPHRINLNNLAASMDAGSDSWLSTSSLCFAASLLIETAVSLLLSTSRRSLRGRVDAAVLVGVAASLTFAGIGIGVCSTRRRRPSRFILNADQESPDTIARGAVAAIKGLAFVAVCVWAGVLIALILI